MLTKINCACLALSCIVAFSFACGGSSGGTTPTPQRRTPTGGVATTPETAQAAAPTSGGGKSQPSLQLSGTVTGSLIIVHVTCSADGLNVLISGNVAGATYGLDINAPNAGTFQFGTGQNGKSATAQLLDSVAQRRWSLGITGGAGSLEVSQRAGNVDADFPASAGTAGTVHINGSWACP